MHQKAFGDRALPGPAGRAYSAPRDPLAAFRERGPRGERKKREIKEKRGGKRKGK